MLEKKVKKLAKGANYATITTLLDDGAPATHVMWVDADDESIVMNTETHRAKYRNLKRDPRVTVAIWDKDNPYDYVEVRGEVTEMVAGPEARKHIDDLSEKYTGGPYATPIQSERVILKIRPNRQRA